MPRSALSSLLVTQRLRTRAWRAGRIGQVALACATLSLLSACGGGDRAEEYRPDRVVALGDENSAFASVSVPGSPAGEIKGLVYSVNAVLPVIGFCNAGTPTQRCNEDGIEGTADDVFEGSNFEFTAGDLTLPLGTGSYVPPDGDIVNLVRLLGLGGLTYTNSATPAAEVTVASPNAKRDVLMQYQCSVSVTAVQYIAHYFGKGFADACPLDAGGAYTYAEADKKVADLQVQVNRAQAAGHIGKGSLVTIWIGQNDIIEIAEDGSMSDESKVFEAKQRANNLAQIVKQVFSSGAKVVVIGVPNLALSPWGASRTALAASLVNAFNTTLELGDKATGIKGLQEYTFRGRDYTFVRAGDLTADYAGSTSYVNNRFCPNEDHRTADAKVVPTISPTGAIVAQTGNRFDVQFCTSALPVLGGSPSTYIWADDYRLGRPVHEAIANTAMIRIVNQF